jgi:hypothetical protein
MKLTITGKKITGVEYNYEEGDNPKKDEPSSIILTLEGNITVEFYAIRDEWDTERIGIIAKEPK